MYIYFSHIKEEWKYKEKMETGLRYKVTPFFIFIPHNANWKLDLEIKFGCKSNFCLKAKTEVKNNGY